MTRKQVYSVLDGEREYQNKKWGGESHDQQHGVNDFIVYMKHHLDKAITKASTELSNEGSLEELRKVTALGIACFEILGVPERKV